MYKLSKTRIYIILAICLAGIFFAVPNVIGDKTKLPKWWRPVNLGLDLQGGSNLLLQVKVDDVIRERMGQVEDDARQVLRENKIRYQNLKAGADNVKVKIDNLPQNERRPERAGNKRRRNRNPLQRTGLKRAETESGRPVD